VLFLKKNQNDPDTKPARRKLPHATSLGVLGVLAVNSLFIVIFFGLFRYYFF